MNTDLQYSNFKLSGQLMWAFFTCAILCVFAMPVMASKKATDMMAEGLKLRSAGNYSSAVRILLDAIDETDVTPQKNFARFMLGDCFILAGRFSDARRVFEEIIESEASDDEKAEAMYRIAQSWSAEGNQTMLRQACTNIKQRFPGSSYAKMAEMLSKTMQPSAKANYEAVAIKSPQSAARPDNPPAKPSRVARPAPAATRAKVSPVRLRQLLNIATTDQGIKEELALHILADQDLLKQEVSDDLLFRLASSTAAFGEYVESCRYYDRLLTEFPNSELVEAAYFESIRLRAILGLHQIVIEWGRAFKKTFQGSHLSSDVDLLVSNAENELKRQSGTGMR